MASILGWFAIPPPVDRVLSELSSMTQVLGALHGVVHSLIELHMPYTSPFITTRQPALKGNKTNSPACHQVTKRSRTKISTWTVCFLCILHITSLFTFYILLYYLGQLKYLFSWINVLLWCRKFHIALNISFLSQTLSLDLGIVCFYIWITLTYDLAHDVMSVCLYIINHLLFSHMSLMSEKKKKHVSRSQLPKYKRSFEKGWIIFDPKWKLSWVIKIAEYQKWLATTYFFYVTLIFLSTL